MNILIVDDSSPMRAVIIKTIKASGFAIDNFLEASDGMAALKTIRENARIDLIITDYNMPKMNGLELLYEMRKDPGISDIPVVFVTSEGSHDRMDTFIQSGAADYLKKPFTPEAVKKKLCNIFGEKANEIIAESGNESLDF